MPYNRYFAKRCPWCGYRTQLRVDDTFMRHKDKTGAVCPGSYRNPADKMQEDTTTASKVVYPKLIRIFSTP